MAPFEARTVVRNYRLNCQSPGTNIAMNINANVTSPFSDPNTINNQAQNQPSLTITNDNDIDDDTWTNNQDNCPFVPNPDQANADGDSQGNACDSDDDNDGLGDSSDACPLAAEDPDGVDDQDGCPDTDASVSASKEESFSVLVNTDVTKTVNISVQNGNHAADILVHILAVSTPGQCVVHMVAQTGDDVLELTANGKLHSQLEWVVSMDPNETYLEPGLHHQLRPGRPVHV